tara:strand:- start:34 stop:480 length:447 start_codon:yes stop_codon:yes gene_type:complete
MKTPRHRFKTLKGYTIFEDGSMIGPRGKYLKPQPEKGRHGKTTAYNYRLYFDKGTFEDYSYQQTSSKKQSKTIPVHRLTKETFHPIDEYPPEELKDTWNDVPEEWRRWVRKTALIDHKDNDPSNNHISNLRWSDTLNNSNFRKEREFK